MPNLIYGIEQTIQTFEPSGGTVVFTATSLAQGAGRISAQLDLGDLSTPRSVWFKWKARTRFATAPTLGRAVRQYIITSDTMRLAAYPDSGMGTADAGFTPETLIDNAYCSLESIVASEASTSKDFSRSGSVFIPFRYVQIAWWNDSAVALSATGTHHEFALWPIPDQIQ